MQGRHQILILDCHGETRPALCFSLEISGYPVRVVTRADEAINLLETAKLTGNGFSAFLINNPCSDHKFETFLTEVLNAGSGVPVIFVGQFDQLEKMLDDRAPELPGSGVYYSDPLIVKSLLAELLNDRKDNPLQAGRYG